MASLIRIPATARTWLPGPLPRRCAARTAPRPAASPVIIAVSRRARAAWAPLRDIAYATPGTVIVGLDGTTLRIREDGGAEEVRT